jgi:hypothetical protein
MKMTKIILKHLVLIISFSIVLSNTNKSEKNRQDYGGYYNNNNENQYVLPQTISKSSEYVVQNHRMIPLNSPGLPMPGVNLPVINEVRECACAIHVRCRPCAMVASSVIPDTYPIMSNLECPCAPRPNCPVCPPLSLLHEIASKKVKIIYKIGD